jgi:hypothetical protein
MNGPRRITASLGLTGLLLLTVVASSRAQSPPNEPDKPATPRAALRERLVELRTRVEVLQLEHDADKEDLLTTLKTVRKLQRDGLPKEEREALGHMAQRIQQISSSVDEKEEAAFLEDLTRKAKSGPDKTIVKYVKDKGFRNINYVVLGDMLIEQEGILRVDGLKKDIDEKTRHFTKQSAQLNTLKLELEDVEHRYADTR